MRINSLVDAAGLEKDIAVLSPEESHHLARVLRVQPGQEITLFDGKGNVAEGTLESVSKTTVEVRITARRTEPKPPVEIDLIQAVPKPDRWALVLQKAVELGVSRIQPVLTKHTEFRPNPKKEDRWRKIVLNAAQQCEVRWLPELQPLAQYDAVVPTLGNYDLVLVGSLYEGAVPFREVNFNCGGTPSPASADSGDAVSPSSTKRIALLIGPEGDFTEDEVGKAVEKGAVPVSFGNRILRTETAAIYGLSVLAYQLL